mmetsp:Transcript_22268/g.55109  ORF Transcript_22268/g.55109 Transcript_22268/m.55109 type:complete len:112 (-) Transcript_22268:1482-1817(-)
MPYTLAVRDSIMIAHSFHSPEFGPAQNMHGATYTVDCEFVAAALQNEVNWVVDIGEALSALGDVLKKYNMKNLDDIPEFKGQNTTTEFMCKAIHDDMQLHFKDKFNGSIKV